jgi:hypothetical protein
MACGRARSSDLSTYSRVIGDGVSTGLAQCQQKQRVQGWLWLYGAEWDCVWDEISRGRVFWSKHSNDKTRDMAMITTMLLLFLASIASS